MTCLLLAGFNQDVVQKIIVDIGQILRLQYCFCRYFNCRVQCHKSQDKDYKSSGVNHHSIEFSIMVVIRMVRHEALRRSVRHLSLSSSTQRQLNLKRTCCDLHILYQDAIISQKSINKININTRNKQFMAGYRCIFEIREILASASIELKLNIDIHLFDFCATIKGVSKCTLCMCVYIRIW